MILAFLRLTFAAGVCLVSVVASPVPPAPGDAAKTHGQQLRPETHAAVRAAVARGLDFLRSRQNSRGGWTEDYGPAITAIVAQAFAQDRSYGPAHPVVRRALADIMRHQQSDGGIYERGRNLANYQTSVVLMFLAALKNPEHRDAVARARHFLVSLQYDEDESVDRGDPWYGGAGYNSRKRPDLSNTQMMLEALRSSGLPPDDPVYQRALVFVSRCQMLDATNDQPFADGSTDGGFIYSSSGESKASEYLIDTGKAPRSYGSMTYAGYKSLLYAGLSPDDPRVRACLDWIRRNYTLDANANMPGRQAQEGLYYYYHVFARALVAAGEPVIVDAAGRPHVWREELCRRLVSLQRPDGSWYNDNPRWMEGDANYVTGLTILTLQTAMAGAPRP